MVNNNVFTLCALLNKHQEQKSILIDFVLTRINKHHVMCTGKARNIFIFTASYEAFDKLVFSHAILKLDIVLEKVLCVLNTLSIVICRQGRAKCIYC